MSKSLLGQKVAYLVANGLNEQDLIASQKIVQALGADTRIISMDQGLVSSLNETGWGLNFAADQALNQSLAADYAAIIVPGGQRSIEKLQLTAHTKRFLRGFYDMEKPVCVIKEAKGLLEYAEITDTDAKNLLVVEDGYDGIGEFLERILLEENAIAA